MDAINRMLGRETEPETCPSLSFSTRMYCFAGLSAIGLVCTFMSIMFLPTLAISPVRFALSYTIGNIVSLGATAFLMGPMKQLKQMFDPTRAVASVVYLCALVLTLICSLYLKNGFLTLLMVIVQACALAWYCLSYVPFGRQLVTNCCSTVVGV